MDPITQGALGAVAGASVSGRATLRKATLVGWVAGMLADADIFIRSDADPLLTIEFHRHFTHSLIFIPVGALLCAGVFWLLGRRRWKVSFGWLYLIAFAGYATAGLLDACTSYGTQLLWPFSNERIAWNIISIIDPVFTGTILVLLGVGFLKRRPGWARAGLVFAACYLALGVLQNVRTTRLQEELATKRGHEGIERATVKPTIGNLILWRSVYRWGDRFYVDGIRTGLWGQPVFYKGVSVPVLALEELQEGLPSQSVLSRDLARFDHFSDGYLAWHPGEPGVIGDLRYGALPQSVKPLWGIRVDREKANEHAPFEGFQKIGAQEREDLVRMLKGEVLTRRHGGAEEE
jgi:inner membrane protein